VLTRPKLKLLPRGLHPARFGEIFAQFFNSKTISDDRVIDSTEEYGQIKSFLNELAFQDLLEKGKKFLEGSSSQVEDFTRDDFFVLQQILEKRFSHFVTANQHERLTEFYNRLDLKKLSSESALHSLEDKIPSLSQLTGSLLENKSLDERKQLEVDGFILSVLKHKPEHISITIFNDILKQLNHRSETLQNAILGKPGKSPSSIYADFLQKAEEGIGPSGASDYKHILVWGTHVGHPAAYAAYLHVLQHSSHPFWKINPEGKQTEWLSLSPFIKYDLIENILSRDDVPSGIRADLKAGFQSFREKAKATVSEEYRKYTPVGIALLIEVQSFRDKKLFGNLEEIYKQNHSKKEYKEPDYSNLGTALINDMFNNSGATSIAMTLADLSLWRGNSIGMEELKRVVNEGQGGVSESLDELFTIESLASQSRNVMEERPIAPELDEKQKQCSEDAFDFFDNGINVKAVLAWTEKKAQGGGNSGIYQIQRTFLKFEDLLKKYPKKIIHNAYEIYIGGVKAKQNDLDLGFIDTLERSGKYKSEQEKPIDALAFVFRNEDDRRNEKAFGIITQLATEALKEDGSRDQNTLAKKMLEDLESALVSSEHIQALLEQASYEHDDRLQFKMHFQYNSKAFLNDTPKFKQDAEHLKQNKNVYVGILKRAAEEDGTFTLRSAGKLLEMYQLFHETKNEPFLKETLVTLDIQSIVKHFETRRPSNTSATIIMRLAMLGNQKAMQYLFTAWKANPRNINYLLTEMLNNDNFEQAQQEVLNFVETQLYGEHPDEAFLLLKAAANNRVVGSFEILGRLARFDEQFRDQAVELIFTRNADGAPSFEQELVRNQLINDWVNLVDSDQASEEFISYLSDIANSENSVPLYDLEDSIASYNERRAEEAKAAAEEEARKAEAPAEAPEDSTPAITLGAIPNSVDSENEDDVDLQEVYSQALNTTNIGIRSHAIDVLFEHINSPTQGADAAGYLRELTLNLPVNENGSMFIENIISGLLLTPTSTTNTIDALDDLVAYCESYISTETERCSVILSAMKESDTAPYSSLAADLLATLESEE